MKQPHRGPSTRPVYLAFSRPTVPREPKRCCVCGNAPCLRIVDKRGYCADHVKDAFLAVAHYDIRNTP
jgi:hypothetical protein